MYRGAAFALLAAIAGGSVPAKAQAPETIPAAEPALLDDALFEVDAIVVTPRRSDERLGDTPVAIQVIDRAQIETSSARDAAEVLNTQSGLQIDSSFRGQGVLLQGLDPQHALVLVDGERLVGARDGAIDLSRFFASDIERIEIMRGPASAIYGSDAMAGVINIITRPPTEELSGEGLLRYGLTRGDDEPFESPGQHGDGWVSVAGGSKTVRSRLSLGARRLAAFDLTPSTLATTSSASESYNGQARVDFIPQNELRIPLFLRVQRRDQTGVDENGSGAVYDRTVRTDELNLTASPSLTLSANHHLSLSTSYARSRSQYLRDQRGDDDGDDYEDAREQMGTIRLQSENALGERCILTTGTELMGQHFRSPRLLKLGERGRLSPYAQLEWTMTDAPRQTSVLVPSVRVDVDSQFGTNLSPRLAARVDPMAGLVLRGSAGRGFRAPSFGELLLNFENPSANYRVSGNPNLSPETSVGASVSAELSRFEGVLATLNLFHNELRDLIDTRLVAVEAGEQRFAYVNVRSARTQGFETTWLLRPLSMLTLDVSYTLTHARDLELKRALPGRAKHRASLRAVLGGPNERWTVSSRALWVSSRRFYAEQGDQVITSTAAPYLTLDARAALRVGEHVEPFISAENLTNAGGTTLPIRPMTVYVGVTISS